MQGSDAVADAAIAAGCRFFTGYPMLPFTELLENMAKKLPAAGGVCINAESEIEAINMALGAAATGARAATGSCGQGVSLMQEGIAELALNELPMVVFNMARGQQDYFQSTRGGGWGDYRTITLAPKDIPEAVAHTQLLFYLADLYRTPVIFYGDYVIAHTSVGIEVEALDFGPLPSKDHWALDGTMSGTGQARQIWTWARGKPNTPGPGPEPVLGHHCRQVRRDRADRAALRDLPGRGGRHPGGVVRHHLGLRRPGGRRAAGGGPVASARSGPSPCGRFPAVGLAEATKGCRRVLVYELNAGQMVDDVRMYAEDRSVIRSIGGVSQDASGMRQGDLLNADELRTRDPPGRGRADHGRVRERGGMTTVDIHAAPEPAGPPGGLVQARTPAVVRARPLSRVRPPDRLASRARHPGRARSCRAGPS